MNSLVKVNRIEGNLYMSSSKSLLHRYLILTSRSKDVLFEVKNLSDDVLKTIEILQALGSKISIFKDYKRDPSGAKSYIKMLGYEAKYPRHIDFGESGSSYRFLLPQCFLEERKIDFIGRGRLEERPIKDLLELLRNHGIELSSDKLPFTASGSLKIGDFKIRGDLSSQYISGLMMLAHSLTSDKDFDKSLRVMVEGPIRSFAYVNMTAQIMKELGYEVTISEDRSQIIIDKTENPVPKFLSVEGDWSNAIVPIALAILKGNLIIYNLSKASFQGDKRLADMLLGMGADIRWEENFLIVNKSQLQAATLNMDENIDLFPVLSVLAASCKGKSRFTGLDRLQFKESNRLEVVYKLHKAMGLKSYIENGDFIVVPGPVKSFKLHSHNDHRIVMAAVVASALGPIEVEIEGFEAVNKSYRAFEKDMLAIGVKLVEA